MCSQCLGQQIYKKFIKHIEKALKIQYNRIYDQAREGIINVLRK